MTLEQSESKQIQNDVVTAVFSSQAFDKVAILTEGEPGWDVGNDRHRQRPRHSDICDSPCAAPQLHVYLQQDGCIGWNDAALQGKTNTVEYKRLIRVTISSFVHRTKRPWFGT